MTTLIHFPENKLLIRLQAETPLSFLNDEFLNGIPVSPCMMSLSGVDCFEFNPNTLPEHEVLKKIAKAICSDKYPEHLLYGLFRYNTVMIPCEWIEVVS